MDTKVCGFFVFELPKKSLQMQKQKSAKLCIHVSSLSIYNYLSILIQSLNVSWDPLKAFFGQKKVSIGFYAKN